MKLIIDADSYPRLLVALRRSDFRPSVIIPASPVAEVYAEKFSMPMQTLPRGLWTRIGEGLLMVGDWEGLDWELIEEALKGMMCIWVSVTGEVE